MCRMDKNKRPTYMLFTVDSLGIQRDEQGQSERMEKDLPCKLSPKEGRVPILIQAK